MTTLHLVGLPHTETTSTYLPCAYTQKLVKFCRMMTGGRYRIVLYAGERNAAPCDEFVPLISQEEREGWFGVWDASTFLDRLSWDGQHPAWVTMNLRAADAIRARAQPQDLVLLSAGAPQALLAARLGQLLVVEYGVGYEGILGGPFCAFESYAWMHHVYGLRRIRDGRAYDQVIPNYFDPADFALGPKRGYLVFLGRVTQRKGPHVAAQIADACGMRLVVAGPAVKGYAHTEDGALRIFGDAITFDGRDMRYVGMVDTAARAELLAGATALLVPTLYLEPFGGVAIEAMLSGTPVVASDWGAFPETVEEGVTGYRFRTLAQAVAGVEACRALDPARIRARAIERFSLAAVRPRYERWFEQLEGLWGEGWAALPGKEVA